MFLAPAVVVAAVIEFANALKSTEDNSSKLRGSVVVSPSSSVKEEHPYTSRPPKRFEEYMTDKQLVVFGGDSKPGVVSYTAGNSVQQYLPYSQIAQYTPQEIATSPIIRQVCDFAVKSAFPSFTPAFLSNIAVELCFKAIYTLVQNGKTLVENSVVELVKKSWNVMSKKVKNSLPWKNMEKAAKMSTRGVKARAPRSQALAGLNSMSISAPAAQSMVTGRVGQPKMRNNRRGVVITHSEMLNTLISSASANTFKVVNFTVNPAKADVFPWLSSIATSYDKYRMRKLRLTLNTVQSTNVAGKYGLGYDPDSTDDMPVDRSEVYAMYKHMESPVWQSISMDVPVSGKELYCNTHAVADSKLVDDGMIILFSDLLSNTSVQLADVIVEYEVELLDPQQALFTTQVETFIGVVFTAARLLTPTSTHGPNLSTNVLISATAMLHVPSPGYYKIEIFLYDSGAATPVVTVTNNTTANIYGFKVGNTTTHITTLVCKVYTNSINAASAVVTGETVGLTLSGAGNWLALENFQITTSRVTPTIYANYSTTGWTTVAPAGTL